jgi:hypothetical protein
MPDASATVPEFQVVERSAVLERYQSRAGVGEAEDISADRLAEIAAERHNAPLLEEQSAVEGEKSRGA